MEIEKIYYGQNGQKIKIISQRIKLRLKKRERRENKIQKNFQNIRRAKTAKNIKLR